MKTLRQVIKELQAIQIRYGDDIPVYVYADHGQSDILVAEVETGFTDDYDWMLDTDNDCEFDKPYVCIVAS